MDEEEQGGRTQLDDWLIESGVVEPPAPSQKSIDDEVTAELIEQVKDLEKTATEERAKALDDGELDDDDEDDAEFLEAYRKKRLAELKSEGSKTKTDVFEIGRAVQQECRDRSRMPSSA
eukprot:TRINITY_DN6483_c0_g1_i2.p1 TRINITY_DN6483_c0_g1~~TRINITY_DN6483_c0_g1_i2.p1  ORF type:complete len:119 (+),score=35.61 TRINITY_DN6483_c0_g1_i2:2-358(+)